SRGSADRAATIVAGAVRAPQAGDAIAAIRKTSRAFMVFTPSDHAAARMAEGTEQGIRPFLAQNCRLPVYMARSRSAAPSRPDGTRATPVRAWLLGLIAAFSIRRVVSKLRFVDQIRTPVAGRDAYGI